MNAALPAIIAVDDELDDIFFVRSMLQRVGPPHRFQHFSNGDAAIAALSGLLSAGALSVPPPLACLLDIRLIGISGFDVLRWIRSQRPLDLMPVIMFSGSDDPRDLESARELGAQSYVKKYPSAADMKTLLQEAGNFAAEGSPRKGFLRWDHRFIGREAVGF